MYHFLHKHRYWFLALATLAIIAIIFFQLQDDGGMAPGPNPQPVRAITGP